jgi:hypothetical protein
MDSGQDHLLLHHLPVLVQASVNTPHLPLQYETHGSESYDSLLYTEVQHIKKTTVCGSVLVSMRMRTQVFISMRIQIRNWIQGAKPMQIHADRILVRL